MSITGQVGVKTGPTYEVRDIVVSPAAEHRVQEISVQEMLMPLVRHWRWVVGFALALAAVFAAGALTKPRTYTASASFVPQGSQSESSRLMGLAAAFGLTQTGGGEASALYIDLLKSRRVLETVAASRFAFEANGKRHSGTLLQLLGLDGSPSKAIEALKGAISINSTRRSRIIEINVTMPWAPLAEQVAARVLEVTNDFSGEIRRSQVTSERQFVEARLAESAAKLAAVESDLSNFLQRNRQFRNAPELLFEHDRLQRKVAERQALSTALSNAYEQARIEEVRNTPVMTIVERPASNRRPNPRGTTVRGVIGLVVGAALGLMIGVLTTMLPRARDDQHEPVSDTSRWAGEEPRGESSVARRPADLRSSGGLAAVGAPSASQSPAQH